MSRIRCQIAVLLSLAAGLILTGTGCVKIDASVSLEREGSGTLRAVCGMPSYINKQAGLARKLSASLDAAAGKTNVSPKDLDVPFVYDEAVLRTKFTAMAREGILLESLKIREQGGWNYVDFTLKFKELETLFRQSFFRDFGVVFKRLDEKSCKLTIALPPVGSAPDVASTATLEDFNKLTPFFNGLRVVTRWDLPSEIKNSNSLLSDTRRATWEWDFDKDARALIRLSHDKIVVVFDGSEIRMKDFVKRAGSVLSDEK